MLNINKIADVLTNKLECGQVKYLNEDNQFIYFNDDVFVIRVTKEIKQDRNKVEIKELNTNEEYGFYSVILNDLIKSE